MILALYLPTAWYDALPRQPGLPPLPIRGTTLLQLTFFVEALVFAVLAFSGRSSPAMIAETRPWKPEKVADGDIPEYWALWILLAITVLAAVLRSISLGSDLWIDEITPLVDYGKLPVLQVIGSYLRSNNHLLNTLLVKLSVAMFGEHEWSVRLPAVMFGVAAVPALYWLGRLAVSRAAALGAALMLATSYHHIFFSQNSRGYTAYIFFAIVSAAALVRALAGNRPRHWAAYVISVVLGFASLITSAFVFAAHGLIALVAVLRGRNDTRENAVTLRRIVMVFGIAGVLSFQLYAASLPEAYVVITSVYQEKGTGFAPFSLEFVNEVVRGITAGFAGVPAAGLFGAIGALGFVALVIANGQVAASLALPLALIAGLLVARGLTFSPRFFLLGLPLALLSAVAALEAIVGLVRKQFGTGARIGNLALMAFAVAVSGIFAASLPYYYRTPKQPYRAALQYVETVLQPGDNVAVVYVAESGFSYYILRDPVRDASVYHYVRKREDMDALLARTAGSNTFVVTTLPRMLGLDLPEVSNRIRECCEPINSFAGTLGDGAITVWRTRTE